MFRYYLASLKRVSDLRDLIRADLKRTSKLSSLKGGAVDLFDDIISTLDTHLPQLRDITYSQILGTDLPGLQAVRDLNQAFT